MQTNRDRSVNQRSLPSPTNLHFVQHSKPQNVSFAYFAFPSTKRAAELSEFDEKKKRNVCFSSSSMIFLVACSDSEYTEFIKPGASIESRHCGQDKRIFFCPVLQCLDSMLVPGFMN